MNNTLKASTAAVAQVMLALTLSSPQTSAQSTALGSTTTQRPFINTAPEEQAEKMVLDSTSQRGIEYFFADEPYRTPLESTHDVLYFPNSQENKSSSAWLKTISHFTNIEGDLSILRNTSIPFDKNIEWNNHPSTFDTPPYLIESHLLTGTSRNTSGWIQTLVQLLENDATRETTQIEQIAGEIRSYALRDHDWDGEGAVAPITSSLQEAVIFINLLPVGTELPEPMLFSSGHAGLFWESSRLYADLKFLGDGHIAYFIEDLDEGKHKGIANFDSKKMPAVLSAFFRV